MNHLRKLNKLTVCLIGLLIGALVVLGIRFATYKPEAGIHYHANFAIYINSKRELFNNPLIYEELISCSFETVKVITPSERAHMHDNVNDVVHVEDDAVTWGNFFQNIGWTVNTRYVDTSEKVFMSDDTNKVSFILNGEEISSTTSRVINSKDRLLISYGTSTKDELKTQYDSIATTAEKYNTTKDPASCSGGHEKGGMKDRLKHLL